MKCDKARKPLKPFRLSNKGTPKKKLHVLRAVVTVLIHAAFFVAILNLPAYAGKFIN